MPPEVEMSLEFAGLHLQSPLIAAAGTCGYVSELPEMVDPRWLGAITTKSITAEPRNGNPPLRMIDLPVGMLNAIGLANVGLEAFIRDKLPAADSVGTTIIGSIAGHSVDDYVKVAAAFDEQKLLPAVELNVSCPNTETGLEFGTDAAQLRTLLQEVRPVLKQTKMIVKLSPNVTDIRSLAEAAIDSGADGLTLINTIGGMAIDVHTRQPRLSRGSGGLSGPAVHPVAVHMVHQVYRDVAGPANVPIIGLGGVMTWHDAAELILAGATAVGLGTVLFVDPKRPKQICRGLEKWAGAQSINKLTDLVGQVQRQ